MSYSSVLGDLVWKANGLKTECVASLSLVLWCSSPVPVLYCNSRWFILHYRSSGEWRPSGGITDGREMFESV